MKKRIFSMMMSVLMLMTSLTLQVSANSTPYLALRFAGYDESSNIHVVNRTGNLETALSPEANSGSPVSFYFIDENNQETLVQGNSITSSNSDVVSLSVDSQVADVTHISFKKPGTATLDYTYNNTVYSVSITVNLPSVGLYSSTTVSAQSLIDSFTVTDTSNTFYLVANGVTLSNVRLTSDFDEIANLTLIDSTTAKIQVTGMPDENFFYMVEGEATDSNNGSFKWSTSIKLINHKGHLKYYWVNYENGTPVKSDHSNLSYEGSNGDFAEVYFYYAANGTETRLTASDLTCGNSDLLGISAHGDYSDIVVMELLGFGNTTVNYGGYQMNVTSDLPGVGFYTGTEASKSTFIKEFIITDSSNTFYLVAKDQTIEDVTLRNDFGQFATVSISSDQTYATITINGSFNEDERYNAIATLKNSDGREDELYLDIQLKDYRPSLKAAYGMWENNVIVPGSYTTNSISISKGGNTELFFAFFNNGNQTDLKPSDLVSSDENVVKITAHDENPNFAVVEAVDFGSAKIQYTDGTITYELDVTVELPMFGFYSSNQATQANYLSEFTVTDEGPNKIYLISLYHPMNKVTLNDNLSSIASVNYTAGSTVAEIEITGTPSNDDYGVEIEFSNNGNTETHYRDIKLINGKTSLMIRFPDFSGDYPTENTDWPLVSSMEIMMGNNDPAYFYLVKDGQEVKLGLEDLKSSDENIVVPAVYSGSDAIVVESKGFGTANIMVEDGGKTYTFPVSVVLPWIGAYSNPSVNTNDYLSEFTVTTASDTFYIMNREGWVIQETRLEDDLNRIASYEISADGKYVKVTVTGVPEDRAYCYEVKIVTPEGEEWHGREINLINNKPYLAFCWPETDDGSMNHGDLNTLLDTALGYETDVWVYLVDGTNETLMSYEDLQSTNTDVLDIVDPGYGNHMVKLVTTGWGQAEVTYTDQSGTVHSFDVDSHLHEFGYYKDNQISQENWIRSLNFSALDGEDNVIYFKASGDVEFTNLYPTQGIQNFASYELSQDKKTITITFNSIPSADQEYGFDFECVNSNGDIGGGTDILHAVTFNGGSIVTGVDSVPVVDSSETPAEVEVGVDENQEDTLDSIVNSLVNEVLNAEVVDDLTNIISTDVFDVIKEALEQGKDLAAVTSVEVEKLGLDTVSERDLVEIENWAENYPGAELAQLMDLKVVLTVIVEGIEDSISTTISELSEPVTFTIVLPEELRNVPEGYKRTAYVVRVHNDNAEMVAEVPFDSSTQEIITFASDKFSTYALYTVDEKIESGNSGLPSAPVAPSAPSVPNTSDDSQIGLYGLMMVLSALIMSLMTWKKKLSA